jgi:hypothetical protein
MYDTPERGSTGIGGLLILLALIIIAMIAAGTVLYLADELRRPDRRTALHLAARRRARMATAQGAVARLAVISKCENSLLSMGCIDVW